MFNPFDTDHLIRNLFYHLDCSENNKHFKTVMGIEMNMQGRNDLIMMGVLVVGQLVGEVPYVMIVNQRHRANRLLLLRSAMLLNQRCPDKVANRLGAVHIAFLFNQLIKILQQPFIQ